MVAAQETPFPLVLTAWAVVVYSSRTRVSHSFFSDFVAQSMRPPSTAHSAKLTSTRRLRGGGGEGWVRRARRAPSAERAGLEMARAQAGDTFGWFGWRALPEQKLFLLYSPLAFAIDSFNFVKVDNFKHFTLLDNFLPRGRI